ncbi:TPA: co-chaperone GroES [Vibrio vulnificus]|uniref:GroES family chaperonin n=1 Tax=Vibrio vulnificus TaxID=672 RepID=UPI0009B6CDC9|nr:co-chaperone GroES [Vibrio vulnificus]EHD2239405.1 co-chaperone GroES [Vibrio vulnificus]EHU4867424.1 co-chaperone GroES [Vibrio vulnificus]EIJ0945210.1 co-chaperone GroES [Vibrio vulnificus]ELH4867470.1 co-chaperone GroES [Vibrio vulnificus]MCU8568502.1 co-chaperone GroES [Vibrio vulnificus]
MKLRPLHDWVVIQRDERPRSLLWTPDKPANTGEVVAVGPQVKEVAVGARIQFNPYAGLDVTANGHTWLFINEAEISVIFD